jgi:hypothetical protein
MGISRVLYEKISEEIQKKKKILEENAHTNKMEEMREDHEVISCFSLSSSMESVLT